jgi:hypothetical protein
MTSDTYVRELTFSESRRTEKLLRMLQSISERYPTARLLNRPGAFGVYLDADHSLVMFTSGVWTNEELRDWCALFVTWLAVDPAGLRGESMSPSG